MAATRFGSMLDALIRERCRTIVAFCEAVEATGHKIDKGDVSKIIHGSDPVRRPPKEQIDIWARVLGLSAREAKTFRTEALLTHTPDEIVSMFRAQLAREERHRRVVANLNERIDRLTTPSSRPSDAPGGQSSH